MYESMMEQDRNLDLQTLKLMGEAFRGKTCTKCGTAARRLSGGRFFCVKHFPGEYRATKNYRPRVYRVALHDH